MLTRTWPPRTRTRKRTWLPRTRTSTWPPKDQEKDKDLTSKDKDLTPKDKALTPKDQDKDHG